MPYRSPVVLAAWCAISLLPCCGRSSQGENPLVIKHADKELKNTRVVATLDEPMREGQGLLWCSTMQLAFDALEAELGPPLAMTPENATLRAMIDAPPAADSLDSASYVAMAGFGRDDILGKVAAALEEKFGESASPALLPATVSPNDILAYACLFKDMSFEWPLLRGERGLDFDGTRVAHFGYWSVRGRVAEHGTERREQVHVLHFTDTANWSVEVATKATEDRLIIARAASAPADATLGQVVKFIFANAATTPADYGFLGHDEELRIPVINFDVTRIFSELLGIEMEGASFGGPITDARQNIRFRLDEEGAVLKSAARLEMKSAPPENPRRFICDGPFFVIMMREDAAEPYFVGYFPNDELLVKF